VAGVGLVAAMRACIICGRPSIPGGSRCPQHRRGNWERRRTSRAAYSDPTYLDNRAKILEDSPLCHWCVTERATTADHLRAVAQGGTNDLRNLVPACERCNRLRGASLGGIQRKAKGRAMSAPGDRDGT
jgi:5-methylcytosine-specific restriction endonuclease McrA